MQIVKVKMLTRGPNKTFKPDHVYEVDEQRAAILIEQMHAVPYLGDLGHGKRAPKKED